MQKTPTQNPTPLLITCQNFLYICWNLLLADYKVTVEIKPERLESLAIHNASNNNID